MLRRKSLVPRYSRFVAFRLSGDEGELVTDVEVRTELGELAADWDQLVVACPRPSPFLRAAWVDQIAGERPHILAVRDGARLLGGLALEEDVRMGMRRLRPVGETLGADHLDLVAAPSDAEHVAGTIREWFLDAGPVLVDLRGVRADSWIAEALPGRVQHLPGPRAPWSPLPTSFDEYLAARPPVLLSSLRRAERRLEREGATYRVVPVSECDEAVGELLRLHALVFDHASSSILRGDNAFAAAARAAAACGDLVLHELAADGRPIAIEAVFEVGPVTSFLQGGRERDPRWKSPGTFLIARAIERACALGHSEIDFLRGLEPYKQHWTERERAMVRLLAGVGSRARALVAALPVAGRVRRTSQRLRGMGPGIDWS